jgi:allantoinase
MREHSRYDYSPITLRPRWKLPNDARVALWLIPNIEHFLFDRPSTSVSSVGAALNPDVLNYSWRDYGVRVGIWRLMEIMNKYEIRGTVALNSDVCARYPQIIEAGRQLGWEWMGHGKTNSELVTGLKEDQERDLIREVVHTIASATGQRPRGWLSPAMSETVNTPDLLAEAGLDYVCNWVNDEQPYPLKVRSGSLLSMPYSAEINDIPAFISYKLSPDEFRQAICDQFDVLYEDGAKTGRVMAISVHPFLIGQPHRSKALDKALKYIKGHEQVWFATGSEIVDWYLQTKGV